MLTEIHSGASRKLTNAPRHVCRDFPLRPTIERLPGGSQVASRMLSEAFSMLTNTVPEMLAGAPRKLTNVPRDAVRCSQETYGRSQIRSQRLQGVQMLQEMPPNIPLSRAEGGHVDRPAGAPRARRAVRCRSGSCRTWTSAKVMNRRSGATSSGMAFHGAAPAMCCPSATVSVASSSAVQTPSRRLST